MYYPTLRFERGDVDFTSRIEPDSGITVAGNQVGVGGWTLHNVHSSSACAEVCWVHKPRPHHMRSWPATFDFDAKMLLRTCACGDVHPDPDDVEGRRLRGDSWDFPHSCCGCCEPPPPFTPEDRDRALNDLLDMARRLGEDA